MRFRTVGYVERGEDFPRFVIAAHHEQRAEGQPAAAATYPPPRAPLEVRRSWARLIRQVDEVDSLVCPRCGGTMRVIAVIEQPAVIGRILDRFRIAAPTRAERPSNRCGFRFIGSDWRVQPAAHREARSRTRYLLPSRPPFLWRNRSRQPVTRTMRPSKVWLYGLSIPGATKKFSPSG